MVYDSVLLGDEEGAIYAAFPNYLFNADSIDYLLFSFFHLLINDHQTDRASHGIDRYDVRKSKL